MTKRLFITATDTDAGKTYSATIITQTLVAQGFQVAVYKPISAGCTRNNANELVNEDAQLLMAQSNAGQTLPQINPFTFEEPIAPHIAAKQCNQQLSITHIQQKYLTCCTTKPDFIICEGAGGWRLPLGEGQFLSQFVKQTQQEVILVVNMKLGCLNHAILTYESIISDGLNCIGWIANCPQKMDYLAENIDELTSLINCPLIATFSNEKNCESNLANIDLNFLIN